MNSRERRTARLSSENAERLKDLPDEALRTELERRKQERHEKAMKERQEHYALVRQHKDTLLLFVEHNRTSCSDENPRNGYEQCPRCMLLRDEIDQDDSKYELRVSFELSRLPGHDD